MTNPNPALITDEMWRLWTDRPNPAWLLSGIYADKKGYHNTVLANQKHWPDNYSIKLVLDLQLPKDKARAIDLTMSPSEMILTTGRLKDSALDPLDNRLHALREFYGTLDGVNVFGLIKDTENGPWRRSTADSSHIWHCHLSAFTLFVDSWKDLAPILSVLAGQSLEDYQLGDTMLINYGANDELVRYWQTLHNKVAATVTPPAIKIDNVDGNFGPATAAAFKSFVVSGGGQPGFDGKAITSWLALRYQEALIKLNLPVAEPTPIDESAIKELVEQWLADHVTGAVLINGSITGTVKLP